LSGSRPPWPRSHSIWRAHLIAAVSSLVSLSLPWLSPRLRYVSLALRHAALDIRQKKAAGFYHVYGILFPDILASPIYGVCVTGRSIA
jgi:hypothetical protein